MNSGPDVSPGESLSIPWEARECLLRAFPVSTRLGNALELAGFRLLGDLHGVPVRDLLLIRNFGKKCLLELKGLIQRISQGLEPLPQLAADSPLSFQAERRFFVAPHARDVNPFELPLSSRLEAVLILSGVARLGDLHGRTEREVLRMRSCGSKTLQELKGLLLRAASGEFSVGDQESVEAAALALLRQLDAMVANLPARKLKVVLSGLGAAPEGPQTFARIAEELDLSVERVRQILSQTLRSICHSGGPRLRVQIDRILKCHPEPLPPDTVSRWAGDAEPWPFQHPAAFYAALLTQLRPHLHASWGSARLPKPRPAESTQQIGRYAEQVLRESQTALPLRSCLHLVHQNEAFWSLSEIGLLCAVRRNPNLEIVLISGHPPYVRLKEDAARRAGL